MAKAAAYRRSDRWTAKSAREKLVGQLRRDGTLVAANLADLLESCSKPNPCRNAACPSCGEAFQRVATSVIDTFICEPARAIRGRMSFLTIVPDTGIILPGELTH